MIISTRMNHQRATLQIGQFQSGSQHGIDGIAIGGHGQRGQVAQMAITPGCAMFFAARWVIVRAGAERRNHLAVFFSGGTRRLFMDVESTDAGLQA